MGLGALGTGWLVLSRRLQSGGANNSIQDSRAGTSGATSSFAEGGPTVEAEAKPVDENEEEVRRMARELRDFDIMMADKEERARVEEWRNRSR
ncbi:hypothetical protein DUNSADRAFT_2469 [Dunaliella salina]|uniref:Encoded protein n=1 Tax=Dunaliella salina TaxID=3046 RepID=A0ABQ7GVK0_DUNSA|nr:hypothetical protein DUNSADRAFT_2469 [Dunaliella salina]|eukprot:KAF5838634.1 hypothetical protein DUNSADRAFT_2469 [Dunaliella salina]